jgi:hypothetical protein
MIRDRRILILPLIIVVLFIGIYFISQARQKAEQKPAPSPDLVQTEPGTEVQPKWYIQFSVKGQKSTSYTEAARAPASASSKGYFIGSGAVHPMVPLNAGGDARKPIIPFDTRIYLSQPITVQGQQLNSLVINDTGDVYYGLWRKYPYWVDVYSGTTNYYSDKSALEAGVNLIDYYWYEPWE